MDFAAARTMMVDSQVRVNDVTDRALQAAMLAVPRERFCAPDRAFSAYAEVECEIADGRVLMLPREAAKLLSAVEARPGETALAIGAPPVDRFVTAAGDLLAHIHLQDADGYADRHWAPGDGTVRWASIFRAVSTLTSNPRLILELRDHSEILRGAQHLIDLGLAR